MPIATLDHIRSYYEALNTVLEAQPDVVEAVRRAGRARIVRRSIHLTPLRGHFCDVCLPLETAEIETLGTGFESP